MSIHKPECILDLYDCIYIFSENISCYTQFIALKKPLKSVKDLKLTDYCG